ncbi:MAG: hypothetical protein SOX32_09815 [Candidatus Choladocola sp.]|nr:hypothetical protein [Candidatus Choladocola sp.]
MKREKSKGRKLLLLVSLVMLMSVLFGMNAMAAGTKVVTMPRNSSGTYTYSGNWSESNLTVYHKIKVSKSGVISVAGARVIGSSQYRLSIALCDKNKKSLERYSSGTSVFYRTDDDIALYGVKAGTYYIRVSGASKYVLAADFAAVTDKGGSSKSKATTITRNKKINGVMPAGESATKADWFKFKVTQRKVLYFNISAVGNGRFSFYLYGPSYKKGIRIDNMMNESNRYYSITSGNRKLKVTPGTYYIKAVRTSGSSYKKSSGAYSIKWWLG